MRGLEIGEGRLQGGERGFESRDLEMMDVRRQRWDKGLRLAARIGSDVLTLSSSSFRPSAGFFAPSAAPAAPLTLLFSTPPLAPASPTRGAVVGAAELTLAVARCPGLAVAVTELGGDARLVVAIVAVVRAEPNEGARDARALAGVVPLVLGLVAEDSECAGEAVVVRARAAVEEVAVRALVAVVEVRGRVDAGGAIMEALFEQDQKQMALSFKSPQGHRASSI